MDRSAQWDLISHQRSQAQTARAMAISGNVHVGTGCSAWLYSLRGAIGALPAVRLGVLCVTGRDDARHQPADGTVTR
jgi:hypothetical protein